MEKAAYMAKWRAEHREELLAKGREYYASVRRFQPRPSRRKDPAARCVCGVLLTSRFGGKGRRKYCDGCDAALKRQRHNLYHRRAYAKRVGKKPEPITFA